MIIDKAIEIMTSTKNISVLYEGKPIWIESVDKDKRTAVVSVLGTNQTEEVLVASLTYTGSEM
ncbi:small, acid-soluble spore protein, H family [Clostridium sp. YIM B02515]|uniref:Small, acid-soluble spore protein, H family n=1 Tax=Clostridium rhizosphaerae TaxID=2803861 RepID=A0ABS1TDP5_9CLOT|nr:small, acid-soluble spore protein, H family [Clostridium rhizosphaerae]MBL4936741.1 small, acid-soluble spore protein, H family [Clostridium rhizosphaerae]